MGAPTPHWLEWVRTLWPIFLALVPLILIAGFLWLKTQFALRAEVAAQGAEIKNLDDKVDGHETRLVVVEGDCKSSPNRSELRNDAAVLGGRLSGVESALRGVERMLSTQDAYLRTLVENGLKAR